MVTKRMISVDDMTLDQVLRLHRECCNHIKLVKLRPEWYHGIVAEDFETDRDQLWEVAISMVPEQHVKTIYRLIGMNGRKSMWGMFIRDILKLWGPY